MTMSMSFIKRVEKVHEFLKSSNVMSPEAVLQSAQLPSPCFFLLLFVLPLSVTFFYQWISICYSIPGHSIWKRMPWGEAEMHSFSYTNDQVLYNQFSPYFRCRVSWLPIITNLGSLSQIRLNEYQLKSISVNYNICGIWKIFNNTRQRKYGLITHLKLVYIPLYELYSPLTYLNFISQFKNMSFKRLFNTNTG